MVSPTRGIGRSSIDIRVRNERRDDEDNDGEQRENRPNVESENDALNHVVAAIQPKVEYLVCTRSHLEKGSSHVIEKTGR